ncbi:hypothetical protein BDQ12DRAFT_676352 [Crucibulum laeve]|uniref:Uncharacterized protein n=1 Tax=Crucibulum laeve TaxID=68775 RepID=A0A5C3MB32_9AGAR|nr:hypothetical protein BDQ12DRAFT_676352 [Crucibulum laeve]
MKGRVRRKENMQAQSADLFWETWSILYANQVCVDREIVKLRQSEAEILEGLCRMTPKESLGLCVSNIVILGWGVVGSISIWKAAT